jgi:hypothetical protein
VDAHHPRVPHARHDGQCGELAFDITIGGTHATLQPICEANVLKFIDIDIGGNNLPERSSVEDAVARTGLRWVSVLGEPETLGGFPYRAELADVIEGNLLRDVLIPVSSITANDPLVQAYLTTISVIRVGGGANPAVVRTRRGRGVVPGVAHVQRRQSLE